MNMNKILSIWYIITTLNFSVPSNSSQLHRNNLLPSITVFRNYKLSSHNKIMLTIAAGTALSLGAYYLFCKSQKKKNHAAQPQRNPPVKRAQPSSSTNNRQQVSSKNWVINIFIQQLNELLPPNDPEPEEPCFDPNNPYLLLPATPYIMAKLPFSFTTNVSSSLKEIFYCDTLQSTRIWRIRSQITFSFEKYQGSESPLVIHDFNLKLDDKNNKTRIYFSAITPPEDRSFRLVGSFFRGEGSQSPHKIPPYYFLILLKKANGTEGGVGAILYIKTWLPFVLQKRLDREQAKAERLKREEIRNNDYFYRNMLAHSFYDVHEELSEHNLRGTINVKVVMITPYKIYIANAANPILNNDYSYPLFDGILKNPSLSKGLGEDISTFAPDVFVLHTKDIQSLNIGFDPASDSDKNITIDVDKALKTLLENSPQGN